MRKCNHCDNDFQPIKQKQHYCSIECKIKNNISIDSNNCWNWTKGKHKDGYGKVTFNDKIATTHRIMCESVHGPAPMDKPNALHSCDNPSCCNPSHLRWGSHQENMDDKMKRNRGNHQKGEKHYLAKLTELQVIEIINKLRNYQKGDYYKLGREYNVGINAISAIHKNRTWKHLPRK